mmetsp:Transcript_3517/g.7788  ORF Transcript_3517/g.7788 Transcript_3517/m.7788 type:complete len:186 (-) Transcript_3517:644-1201(-)
MQDTGVARLPSADWKKESLNVANHLASWLMEKSNGPYKASMLGSFYKENPEAAKIIRTRTLGAFCSEHPHLLAWNAKTHVITVKRAGLSPSSRQALAANTRKGAPTVTYTSDSEQLHALCVLRTWLLAEHNGAAEVSDLMDISAKHNKDYNLITLMGITTFCRQYPQWLVYDEHSNRIILAELCS